MSDSQQNSDSTNSVDQQTTQQPSEGKWMTQAEYNKYKQGDSYAGNFYGFSTAPTKHPVAWDGKFATDPNNVFIVPNRNASDTRNFYGFSREPTILPPSWWVIADANPSESVIEMQNFTIFAGMEPSWSRTRHASSLKEIARMNANITESLALWIIFWQAFELCTVFCEWN